MIQRVLAMQCEICSYIDFKICLAIRLEIQFDHVFDRCRAMLGLK